MGLGKIVVALFDDVLHPEWERLSQAEVRAAQRQERQVVCDRCGLPGGTLVRVGTKAEGKYRHAQGFCRKEGV